MVSVWMRRKIPPLNAIRSFEAVARHEHLGAAAEELCVSHSALSQQVKHLEEWFGRKLFDREKGRLILKAEGKELLSGYSEALDLLQYTSMQIKKLDEEQSLNIQCDPAFFDKCLMQEMPALREVAGETSLDIFTSHGLPTEFPDYADIVIHYMHPPGWADVHSTHLMDVYGIPACSPMLLEKYAEPIKPRDLKQFHLLHGNDRDSWNAWLRKYAGTTTTGSKNTYYDDFSLTIKAAVLGEGVILADPILCGQELASGSLVPLFEESIFEVSYSAFCPKSKYNNRKVRTVYDRIVDIFRAA